MRGNRGQVLSERRSRRRGWTRGQVVTLADGFSWSLPRIDHPLVITASWLQADIVEAFRLTEQSPPAGVDSVEMANYQAHMANTGHRLLQTNYHLPDADWATLLDFTTLRGLTSFTRDVIATLGGHRAVWLPFVKTFGPEGAEVLQIN